MMTEHCVPTKRRSSPYLRDRRLGDGPWRQGSFEGGGSGRFWAKTRHADLPSNPAGPSAGPRRHATTNVTRRVFALCSPNAYLSERGPHERIEV